MQCGLARFIFRASIPILLLQTIINKEGRGVPVVRFGSPEKREIRKPKLRPAIPSLPPPPFETTTAHFARVLNFQPYFADWTQARENPIRKKENIPRRRGKERERGGMVEK